MDSRVKEAIVEADDGAKLSTATSGIGPPVVLCHGGPGSPDYLDPVASLLSDALTVHRWQQRGSGRSERNETYNLARFVQDLENVRTHFGHDRWLVAGHSWGASLGLLYAFDHKDRTEALIYVSGTGLNWARWKVQYHEEARSRFADDERRRYLDLKTKENRNPEEEKEFLILNAIPDFADRERALNLATAAYLGESPSYEVNKVLGREVDGLEESELIERCRRLDVPVLIVHGEGDPRPLAAIDSLIEALPKCEVAVIEGAGHMPWVERPEEFRRSILTFVDTLPTNERPAMEGTGNGSATS